MLETAAFCEAELSEYCRRKAVHPENCASGARVKVPTATAGQCRGARRGQSISASERLRELERELRRGCGLGGKRMALLMLEKKADAIWARGTNDQHQIAAKPSAD